MAATPVSPAVQQHIDALRRYTLEDFAAHSDPVEAFVRYLESEVRMLRLTWREQQAGEDYRRRGAA